MKRRSASLPIDHARDRDLWGGLINDAHAAVADSETIAINQLGDAAVKGRDLWNALAPFPRGLVCRVFACAVHAWARQGDPELRQRLAPMVIASAGLVDELLTETSLDRAAMVIGVDLGSGPSVGVEVEVSIDPDGERAFTPRLPYVEG